MVSVALATYRLNRSGIDYYCYSELPTAKKNTHYRFSFPVQKSPRRANSILMIHLDDIPPSKESKPMISPSSANISLISNNDTQQLLTSFITFKPKIPSKIRDNRTANSSIVRPFALKRLSRFRYFCSEGQMYRD